MSSLPGPADAGPVGGPRVIGETPGVFGFTFVLGCCWRELRGPEGGNDDAAADGADAAEGGGMFGGMSVWMGGGGWICCRRLGWMPERSEGAFSVAGVCGADVETWSDGRRGP